MVVSHFGVRAVVDKGWETCDQDGVCRQSDGKHVTRVVFFDGGVCLVAIVACAKFEFFACVYVFPMVFFFICHCRAELAGRMVVVAVDVIEHR